VGAEEARAPPPSGFPHTMLNVKRVKDNVQLLSLKNSLPTVRLGLAYRQDTCASKVCRMRSKIICVTSVVFSYRKLWLGFDVATCSLR